MTCDVFVRNERRASCELRTFAETHNSVNHIKRLDKLTMQLTGFDCISIHFKNINLKYLQ